jgi:chromosome segregation ATPase
MSKDVNTMKNERIVYLMIITLLVLILAYIVLMTGNDREKKSLLTESEATLRKEIGQLDKVIQERETQVKGLTTKNSKRKEELVEAIKALKKLKIEKEKLLKNVQTLKREHNINLRRITDLNSKIVKLRKDVADVKEQHANNPRTAVDSSVLLVLNKLKTENSLLLADKTYLSERVTNLENKVSSSLPVHVQMAAKQTDNNKINLTFFVFPNKAHKQINRLIKVFYLRYKYNKTKKDTEIERVLVTTLDYKKERMTKRFTYSPDKALDAGTHIFEAMAGGETLGSSKLNISEKR